MSQSHGTALAREPVGAGGTPTVTFGVITLVSPGVYTISLAGTPAASLLDDGAGGFMVSDSDLTGTGRIVIMGGTRALISAGPPPLPTWRSVGARVIGIALRAVLAYPTEFKWTIEQPAQTVRPSRIVPLTLKYGQQPPINGAITSAEMAVIRGAWPDRYAAPVKPLKGKALY